MKSKYKYTFVRKKSSSYQASMYLEFLKGTYIHVKIVIVLCGEHTGCCAETDVAHVGVRGDAGEVVTDAF